MKENYENLKNNQLLLQDMCNDVSIFCKNENEMNEEIQHLFESKQFDEFDCSDISKLLWKMDLSKYHDIFIENQINGELASMMDELNMWEQIHLDRRDCFYILFNFTLMKSPGFCRTFLPDYEENCCVCAHNTPEKTIYLLKEYDIPIDDDLILKNNYCSSILTFSKSLQDLHIDFLSAPGRRILVELAKWKKIHKSHLKDLSKKKNQ